MHPSSRFYKGEYFQFVLYKEKINLSEYDINQRSM